MSCQNTNDAKIILANAVQHVGQSVKVWLTAASLESELKAKKRVLRKGKSIVHCLYARPLMLIL